MVAYLIQTRVKTLDKDELDLYGKMARPTLGGHPVTPRVVYGSQETLEGPETEGVVIFEFPSRAEALAWFQSPDYVEARRHRARGAEYHVTLVDGV